MLDEKQIRELNKKFEFEDSGISLPDDYWSVDYQCPLCPGHVDNEDDFAWSKLLDDLICIGCSHDIQNGFVGWSDKPTPEQYNHADTIERIEQITGLTFQQLKFKYMQDKIVEWGGKVPEVYRDIVSLDMPDSWLKVSNKQLDREFLKLVEANRGEL